MAKDLELKITGLKEAERDVRRAAKEFPKAALRGATKWFERVMTVSKKLCPVDKGTLRASGHVETDAQNMRVTGAYGGAAAGYAAKVHETHPTKSKFFEGPILQMLPDLPKTVKSEVDKVR